jgi:hypothetical protein
MISLLLSTLVSTLRLSARWGQWYLRSRTTLWLIAMARYGLQAALRPR